MADTKECNRCKKDLPLDNFKNTTSSCCISCNEKSNKKCVHGVRPYRCKKCGGKGICVHDKRKSDCIPCGGSQVCPHDRAKAECKDCKGSAICIHGIIKYSCKPCGGSRRCQHGIERSTCKPCGGSQICPHDRIKSTCKLCGGSQICPHGIRKSGCKTCHGSQICIHDRERARCHDCGGSSICIHDKLKRFCKICDLGSYIRYMVSSRIKSALKAEKAESSIEYLGCDIQFFKQYIEAQFHPGMTWENHGDWHCDHIIPIMYNNPTLEEQIARLHYTNNQPLWKEENMKKGNRLIYGVIHNHEFHSEFSDCL